jgi:hypothetical protein
MRWPLIHRLRLLNSTATSAVPMLVFLVYANYRHQPRRIQAFMQYPPIVGNDAPDGLPADRQPGDYPPAHTHG